MWSGWLKSLLVQGSEDLAPVCFEVQSLSSCVGSLVVMYGCKSWTIKKAEHRRIDVYELWYWRRLLRVTLRNLISRNQILGVFIEMALICSSE